MFQISRRTDYAVRIMIELGLYREGEYLSTREVSRRTAVPKSFLHKITTNLVRANLVRTSAGPKGGLKLAQPAADINLHHILEAIEGHIILNTCLIRPGECHRDHICPGHSFWGRLQIMIVEQLQAETLDKLAAEAERLKQHPLRREDIPYLFPMAAAPGG